MDGAQAARWVFSILAVLVTISAGMAGAEGIALALARTLGKERPSARVFFFTHLLLGDALAVAVSFILVPTQSWPLWWSLGTLPVIVVGRAFWAGAASRSEAALALVARYVNGFGLALGFLVPLFAFGFDRLFHAIVRH